MLLKCIHEDFVVREVSLLPPLVEGGSYAYVKVRKRGVTTFEVERRLAAFFALAAEHVGSQGLKDEDAVTEQVFSLRRAMSMGDIDAFNQAFVDSSIVERIGHGAAPVTPRKLHGNVFTIVLRRLRAGDARALRRLLEVTGEGFAMTNYYDLQRFGVPGGTYDTHLVGSALARGDLADAHERFMRGPNRDVAPRDVSVDGTRESLVRFFEGVPPRLLGFMVDSYASFVWNQGLADWIRARAGAGERPALRVGDLFTLPLLGEEDLAPASFGVQAFSLPKGEVAPVAKLKIRGARVSTHVHLIDEGDDERHPGTMRMTLSFMLPPGSYATMLVRQLAHRAGITAELAGTASG
jgi:tRNA pseudouridine13 synthase